MGTKLAKYGAEAKLAGVCAGLARYSGVDVTIIRIGFVLAFVFGVGAPGLIYLILALLMPEG